MVIEKRIQILCTSSGVKAMCTRSNHKTKGERIIDMKAEYGKIYLDLLVPYSTIIALILYFLRFNNFDVYSIYRSEDGDMLDPAHTEIDIILKTCLYIIEGLSKGLVVKQRWLV